MSACRKLARCTSARAERCNAYTSSRLDICKRAARPLLPGKGVLRITPEERGTELFLKVEGRLRGRWVGELRLLWDSVRAEAKQSALRVDLADVDSIDPLGKALLAEMHRSGVEIIAHGCLTHAICDEIVAEAAGSRKKP
jgi:ABC-type transporter Mla MlaB component